MLRNFAECLIVRNDRDGVVVLPVPFASDLDTERFPEGTEVFQLLEPLRPPKRGTAFRRLSEEEQKAQYLVFLDGKLSIRTRGDLQEFSHTEKPLVARVHSNGVMSAFVF